MRLQPHPAAIFCLAMSLPVAGLAEVDHRYLFIGHPRDDQPGEILQEGVERLDFSPFDLLMLGGDYTWRGTGSRATVDYLDAVFSLGSPDTLTAFGNHDTQHKSYLTDKTGRPAFYSYEKNKVTFVVLDTTDDGRDIEGPELEMLEATIDGLDDSTHLVVVHHHLIWLADYAPLAHLQGSSKIGASSNNLADLNFYDEVYPLLLEAKAKGVEVICLGGDRTGTETEEFFIDHTTSDGVRFIGAGLKEELIPSLRTVVVLEHDSAAGMLTPVFLHLTDLPTIPDEAVIINELHYNPSPEQGNDSAFIELLNTGTRSYDLSLASFSQGVSFTFPEGISIAPGEYLIVAADPSRYAELGVRVFDYEGSAKPVIGEAMILRNRIGQLIDSVHFESASPWVSPPNNNGPSLALIGPRLENSDADHWASSDQDGGTPGAANFPPPLAAITSTSDGSLEVMWQGLVPGGSYIIQFSESLGSEDWQTMGDPVTATESLLSFEDPIPDGRATGFYRLGRIFD